MALSDAIGSFASAAGSLLSAQGSDASAEAFKKASDIASQDERIQKESTAIQQLQQQRQIIKTLGGQRAEVAGAGFAESGSSLALMASSAQQGAMTVALTGIQGQILANGYAQQAAAYTGQQHAAEASASASRAGAAGGIVGGALKLFGLFGL